MKDDPILPHRAYYLCNGKKTDCRKSGCAFLDKGECCRTTNIMYAKNGPVTNVREWEERFDIVQQSDGLLYYVEKESWNA